jgi:hypothetical protein
MTHYDPDRSELEPLPVLLFALFLLALPVAPALGTLLGSLAR